MLSPQAKPRSKTGYINARVTPALKKEAEVVLATLGVSTTDAITMFLSQVVLQKGLPFPVRIPNAETIAAINEARKDPGSLKSYDSVDEAMDSLWPKSLKSGA